MYIPWHSELATSIAAQHEQGILPHAIMLSGGKGLGAAHLVEELAMLVLCSDRSARPSPYQACGNCRECQLMKAGSHNDFFRLAPEEEGKQIKVDEVRRLVEFITESSMRGGHKVAVITPVEGLNINGANALLKTLEEPAGNTVIFLVAERPESVLPTIRSRCQIKTLKLPASDIAMEWLRESGREEDGEQLGRYLAIANGEPYTALRYLEQGAWQQQLSMVKGLSEVLKRQVSVSKLASQWDDEFLADRVDWLIQWSEQMMRYVSTQSESSFNLAESIAMLKYLADKAGLERVFELRSQHLAQRKLLKGTTNPNTLLLCESLVFSWLALME